MKTILSLTTLLCCAALAKGQLYIGKESSVHLNQGSVLFVEGDVEMRDAIDGEGELILGDETGQRINANGFAIPNMNVNTQVEMDGNLLITKQLTLNNGIIRCNDFNLTLEEKAGIINESKNSWIETNGSGLVQKRSDEFLENFLVPLGGNAGYAPIYLTTNKHSKASQINVSLNNTSPGAAKDRLDISWRIASSGISGNLDITTTYNEIKAVKGNKSALEAFYTDLLTRQRSNASFNRSRNTINATLPASGGEIFAERVADHVMSLTPNPVYDYGVLKFYSRENGNKEAVISDAIGRIVRKQLFTVTEGINQQRINMAGLAKGYYHLRLSGMDQRVPVVKK